MDRMNKISLSVKPEYFIILALGLLLIPFQWIFAWVIASLFHELCHYLAIRLCGCRVFRIRLNFNGAVMESDLLNTTREILCALAGPLGGFALLLVARWCPRIVICACFQSFYNLIPIFPLDGGRVVHSVLRTYLSESKCSVIEQYLESSILLIFILLGIYAAFWKNLGLIPLVFSVILVIKNKKVKFTCKQRLLRVE